MVLSRETISMEESPVAPVRVAVRIRPLLPTDGSYKMCTFVRRGSGSHVPSHPDQVVLGDTPHYVDNAFNWDTTQCEVFRTSVAPLMDRLLEGFDTSIVMYGQTNTGKTYTLFGPGVHWAHSEAEYGIIPRATRHIFERLMKARDRTFSVKVTFLELCNDSITDLLNSGDFPQHVELKENAEGYPEVIGAQEVECQNASAVFNCLHAGMSAWNLYGPATSHYIFQILVRQTWVTSEGLEENRLSLATFADLGGTANHSYGRFNIDYGLSMDCGLKALNNVVTSLAEWRTKDGCYQQSTLTRLLKESFGGRCFSLVICCISPAPLNFSESAMTLRFGEKVKNIVNEPKVSALLRVVEVMQDQAEKESANADTFTLEFAASQWYKLVHNAEDLFKTLVSSNTLSEVEKNQIEQWLCLKEECEDVIASDEEEVNATEKENRQLEKIDEVTETEDKTDSSKDGDSLPKPAETNEKETKYEPGTDSEEESETENQRPDFDERLKEHMDRLRETTEEAVAIHEDILQVAETEEMDCQVEETTTHPLRLCVPKRDRRRSVNPDTDIPLIQKVCSQTNHPVVQEENEEDEMSRGQPSLEQGFPRTQLEQLEPQQHLKLLTAANEAKHQIKKVLLNLEGGYKQLNELQATIQIKEQSINDMIKNSDTRQRAKQKFQRKRTKLEENYYKIRTQLARAENALSLTNSLNDDKAKLKKEIEKLKKFAVRYEKRLKDMVEVMKQIFGESAKKVLEMENSLQASKRELEKSKQWLEREEARKVSLEQQLVENQHKIKELEEKFQREEHEDGSGRNSASANEEEKLQWIQMEEERLMKLRESTRFQEQQHSISEKREAFLKDKQRNEMNARISHLDQVLKEKSTDLEHIENAQEKEALRREIHNLRSTRDCLVEQRCTLDSKFQKDKTLTTMEERKLLECDEAIEAIDAAIEYKNELICGRKGGLDSGSAARDKGEEMLMARLHTLSPMEMRMLLYKYFQKVIDLRENGRKIEVQLAEKEMHIDTQTWHIQMLTNTLNQRRLAAEQQLVHVQRQHQEKIHLMLRHFAEDSSTAGGASSGTETMPRHKDRPETRMEAREDPRAGAATNVDERSEVREVREGHNEGRGPRRRFLGLEMALSRRSAPHRDRGKTSEAIPQKNLKTLQGSGKSLTTKVTVEGKKLVIMQQEPRKAASGNR